MTASDRLRIKKALKKHESYSWKKITNQTNGGGRGFTSKEWKPGADPGILKGGGGGGSGGIFFKKGGSNHLLGSNLYCK